MFSGVLAATVVKTEAGSLPEGKVKIKLEHDGTVLDVDEDDVEKVSHAKLITLLAFQYTHTTYFIQGLL